MLYNFSKELLELILGNVDVQYFDVFFKWLTIFFTLIVFYFCVCKPFYWFISRIIPGGSKRKGFKKYYDD